jgi:hypothetical protein
MEEIFPAQIRTNYAKKRTVKMAKWYLSYEGKKIGPLDEARAMAEAAKIPGGLAWREGFVKGGSKGEGSILGGLGGLLDGDND